MKNGNKYLAWAFVEAANFAVRFCPEAKRFYERKKSKPSPLDTGRLMGDPVYFNRSRCRRLPHCRDTTLLLALVDLAAVADFDYVDLHQLIAYPRDHAPITHAVLPMPGPFTGERLTKLSGVGGFEQPIVDETLDPALDRLIERGEFFLRRWVKFNDPGQDFV